MRLAQEASILQLCQCICRCIKAAPLLQILGFARLSALCLVGLCVCTGLPLAVGSTCFLPKRRGLGSGIPCLLSLILFLRTNSIRSAMLEKLFRPRHLASYQRMHSSAAWTSLLILAAGRRLFANLGHVSNQNLSKQATVRKNMPRQPAQSQEHQSGFMRKQLYVRPTDRAELLSSKQRVSLT